MFYLTTHSTHFIYGYMASDIWLRTILIVRKETRCRHIGYSYRLIARLLLYAPSHRQDNTYHGLCYTSRGALAGTRNSSMGPPHEGSIRRPIAPWANALPLEIPVTTEILYLPGIGVVGAGVVVTGDFWQELGSFVNGIQSSWNGRNFEHDAMTSVIEIWPLINGRSGLSQGLHEMSQFHNRCPVIPINIL